MKAIVTCRKGFLGQKLAHRLLAMGFNVTVLGQNSLRNMERDTRGIHYLPIDLEDENGVSKACQKQDYVFHCGEAHWGSEEHLFNVNVQGTRNILEGCKQHAVKRLIYVSTPNLYFDHQERLNISETDPLPSTLCDSYVKTKWLAEQEIDKASAEGLQIITLRPGGIFGPGDKVSYLLSLIEANKCKRLPLINQGKALVDLTYVENFVDALVLCMDSPKHTLGKKYNISNGQPLEFNGLIQCLFENIGQSYHTMHLPYFLAYRFGWAMEAISRYFLNYKEPLFTRSSISLIAKSQTLNIMAAVRDLGYRPKISIEEGIEHFANWWKATQE